MQQTQRSFAIKGAITAPFCVIVCVNRVSKNIFFLYNFFTVIFKKDKNTMFKLGKLFKRKVDNTGLNEYVYAEYGPEVRQLMKHGFSKSEAINGVRSRIKW